MPFLRVIRDKRGYETTYLMDWHREGDRQRSHILYVFRTPGGARVGREVLDAEARRAVEASYPGTSFDWNAVLKTQQTVDMTPDPRRQRKRRRGGDEDEPAAAPAESKRAARPPDTGGGRIPAVIEGTTPDERVAFLGKWYPIVRDRIVQRAYDQARKDALLALVERLNPSLWTDADQITTGLQSAAEALDRLTRVLTKRRRRPKRPSASTPATESPAPDSTPPEA